MENAKQLLLYGVGELGKDKRLEAEMLLASVLGYSRASLLAHDDDIPSAEQNRAFRALIQRRANHEPLQYLLGSTNFMGMDFMVTPEVLIPRFDTEILVEKALELLRFKDSGKRALDLCTGSGAIAVSMAKFAKDCEVWASDLSANAIQVAQTNSENQGVKVSFRQGSLFKPFDQGFDHYFDLIASNPPYITSDEFKALPDEVRKEPTMALWGGNDGLKFYRDIANESTSYLKEEGYLLFEIGFAQGEQVKSIMENAGFISVEIIKDWQGHDRVVWGQLK